MTDILSRAKFVLERDQSNPGTLRQSKADLVPELVAEIERLQDGGPWTEHVERQRAMKRERDGECICNAGPDTEGPDEFCPWHGRPYNELLDIIVQQQAEINDPEGTRGI